MSLEPSEAEIILSAIESRLLTVHTSARGQVQTYYADKQTADIQLMMNQPLELSDGSILQEQLPILPNVPIKWLRAGGVTFVLDLQVGDYVDVSFDECSLTPFRQNGETGDVGDLRRFDLSHATATPCLAPDNDPIGSDSLPADGEGAVLNGPGVVRVGSPAAVFVALSTLVDARVATIQQAFDTHFHPSGVGPTGIPAAEIGELDTVASSKLKSQ